MHIYITSLFTTMLTNFILSVMMHFKYLVLIKSLRLSYLSCRFSCDVTKLILWYIYLHIIYNMFNFYVYIYYAITCIICIF